MKNEVRARARAIVTKLLTGQLTPELDPMSFEEEIPLLAVGYLEERDSDWLMTQLASNDYPSAGKLEVAFHLSHSHDAARKAIGYSGSLDEFLDRLDKSRGSRGAAPWSDDE